MNEVMTLDDAPPDWGAYAATCQWWAADCNAHQPARRKQAAPEHPDLITALTTTEEQALYDWLEAE